MVIILFQYSCVILSVNIICLSTYCNLNLHEYWYPMAIYPFSSECYSRAEVMHCVLGHIVHLYPFITEPYWSVWVESFEMWLRITVISLIVCNSSIWQNNSFLCPFYSYNLYFKLFYQNTVFEILLCHGSYTYSIHGLEAILGLYWVESFRVKVFIKNYLRLVHKTEFSRFVLHIL